MKTEIVTISSAQPDHKLIEQAANVLRSGGLVAFPTETVYGLGADALNEDAVQNVFRTKGRPPDNPLIVHIAETDQLFELGQKVSATARSLAEAFWPGPLTLVVVSRNIVPSIVTAGLNTVAVRIPNHVVPRELIRTLRHGIVGPSANLSGRPSPTTAQHVFDDLNGKIEMILDAGPTTIGVESTVVDVTSHPPTILRFGGLTRERIEEIVGRVFTTEDIESLKRSPGTRHRHYATKARIVLIRENDIDGCRKQMRTFLDDRKKIGLIYHSDEFGVHEGGGAVMKLPFHLEEYSAQIFAALRKMDALNVDVILVESVAESGLGKAIMDRLRRASG